MPDKAGKLTLRLLRSRTQPRTARQLLQIHYLPRLVAVEEWNEATFEMVRHCNDAVVKPLCLINRGS